MKLILVMFKSTKLNLEVLVTGWTYQITFIYSLSTVKSKVFDGVISTQLKFHINSSKYIVDIKRMFVDYLHSWRLTDRCTCRSDFIIKLNSSSFTFSSSLSTQDRPHYFLPPEKRWDEYSKKPVQVSVSTKCIAPW